MPYLLTLHFNLLPKHRNFSSTYGNLPTSMYLWSGLMAVFRALVLASSIDISLVGVEMARDLGRHFFGVPSIPPFVECEKVGILSLNMRSTYRTRYSVTTACVPTSYGGKSREWFWNISMADRLVMTIIYILYRYLKHLATCKWSSNWKCFSLGLTLMLYLLMLIISNAHLTRYALVLSFNDH